MGALRGGREEYKTRNKKQKQREKEEERREKGIFDARIEKNGKDRIADG
jgi:hypothetical protein